MEEPKLTEEQQRMKETCLAASARALTAGIMRTMSLDPREAAEKAWRPGGPSVDEIEARIRARHARAAEAQKRLGNSEPA